MCIICDGASPDEALFDLDAIISRNTWAIQGVEPEPDRPGWVYTIGLAAHYHHRELVVVGCKVSTAFELISELARRVEAGEHFVPDMLVTTAFGTHDLVEVHPHQEASSLMAMWHEYYEAVGAPILGPRPLQVVALEATCRVHCVHDWLLDRPAPLLAGWSHDDDDEDD